MNKINYKLSTVLTLPLFMTGCVGYVGGDLKNVNRQDIPLSRDKNTPYQIKVKSNPNTNNFDLADCISGTTLYTLPTYSCSKVNADVTLYKKEIPIRTYHYNATAHRFYGIIWGLILPTHTIDNVSCDEGNGMRMEGGIQGRAASKALLQIEKDLGIPKEKISLSE